MKKRYRDLYNFLSSNSSKFKCIFNIHTGNSYIYIQMIVLAIFSLSASIQ